jgi:hypothetical protein
MLLYFHVSIYNSGWVPHIQGSPMTMYTNFQVNVKMGAVKYAVAVLPELHAIASAI